jgi:hypothetical protein
MDDKGDWQLARRPSGLERIAPHGVAPRAGKAELVEADWVELGQPRGIDGSELRQAAAAV